jgi:ferrochelatase
MDPRVIDIPFLTRFFLINFVIVPFRAPKSALQYKEIWGNDGSPLLLHGIELKEALQKILGEDYKVELGMRYQRPSTEDAVKMISKEGDLTNLIVLPLYPQYASSSTGSSIEKAKKVIKKYDLKIPVKYVGAFFNNKEYLDAFVQITKRRYNIDEYDFVLFSFHGLPERQIVKTSEEFNMECELGDCCNIVSPQNHNCYRAGCIYTAKALALAFDIPENKYGISFQSRLGRTPWLTPHTDKVIAEKAKQGVKKMLVFSPSFVADCLETLYEIKIEYARLFKENGGESLTLGESLNAEEEWVNGLAKIILSFPVPHEQVYHG